VDRPVSVALAAPGDTPLGKLVAARRAAEGARHASGFALLSGPQAAYSSRLALVDAAQKTLDLQYYAIHADASSERLLLSVMAAAQRGVRVRVLLDDFHSTGRDAQVMRLAFVPNIEMRMFNPVTGARGSPIGRMLSLLGDFSRVQQRMHNKLFIADNAMAVTGGRNLGDAYFGNADSGNFVDLDVLAAGPIVQDLSRSFDSYWNNERAYPVQSLSPRANSTTCATASEWPTKGGGAVSQARVAPRRPTAHRPTWGPAPPLRSGRASGTTSPWTWSARPLSGRQRRCWWTSLPRSLRTAQRPAAWPTGPPRQRPQRHPVLPRAPRQGYPAT